MKKTLHIILAGGMAAAMLLALAGCGGNAAQEPAPEEPAEEAELAEYKSDEGWAVQYDPALVEVQSGGGAVDFLYTGAADESSKASLVTISVEADKQPEEVLYEITSNWEDQDAVTRSEGFFPGTEDRWGFWRNMPAPEDGSGPDRTAIAGEYNGGVLLLQYAAWLTGDDAADMASSGAMETIVDSITFEDFQPQTMYDYVPGTYTAEQDGEIRSVMLREDHTGVMTMQEDVDVFWSSIELKAVDGSFTYEYTVEGDTILIHCGDEWLPFTK